MSNDKDSIVIRDANIGSVNFTGTVKSPFDREGKRYILVRLDPEMADYLRDIGWPVKMTKPKPDRPDYEPYPFLKVNIKFDFFYYNGLRKTSKVYMVTKKNKILMDESNIHQLEENYIEKADLKIDYIYYKSFDQWSLVLESGFFTIEPDELYDEYFGSPSEPIFDDEDDIPFN